MACLFSEQQAVVDGILQARVQRIQLVRGCADGRRRCPDAPMTLLLHAHWFQRDSVNCGDAQLVLTYIIHRVSRFVGNCWHQPTDGD